MGVKRSHLFAYAYTYQAKFEFSILNLELILVFFIIVYFSAFASRSLRTRHYYIKGNRCPGWEPHKDIGFPNIHLESGIDVKIK
jgi:hypothetical protein